MNQLHSYMNKFVQYTLNNKGEKIGIETEFNTNIENTHK